MEELTILVELVRDLPQTALWVLVLLFVYKVSIIGSLYGVIRYAIDRTHSFLTTPKHTLKVVERDVRGELDGVVIKGSVDQLVAQVLRIRNKGASIGSKYIHSADIDWLRDAIDEKIARETKP